MERCKDDGQEIDSDGTVFSNHIICVAILRACDAAAYFLWRRVNSSFYRASKKEARCQLYFQVAVQLPFGLPTQTLWAPKRFLPNRVTYVVPSGQFAERMWLDRPSGRTRVHLTSVGGMSWAVENGAMLWKVENGLLDHPWYEIADDVQFDVQRMLWTFFREIAGERKPEAFDFPDTEDRERFVEPPNLNPAVNWRFAPRLEVGEWRGVSDVDWWFIQVMTQCEQANCPLLLLDEQPYKLEDYLRIFLGEPPPLSLTDSPDSYRRDMLLSDDQPQARKRQKTNG